MLFRVSTVVVLLVLNCSLLLTNSAALAGPKEDVAAATMKWGETLGAKRPRQDRSSLCHRWSSLGNSLANCAIGSSGIA